MCYHCPSLPPISNQFVCNQNQYYTQMRFILLLLFFIVIQFAGNSNAECNQAVVTGYWLLLFHWSTCTFSIIIIVLVLFLFFFCCISRYLQTNIFNATRIFKVFPLWWILMQTKHSFIHFIWKNWKYTKEDDEKEEEESSWIHIVNTSCYLDGSNLLFLFKHDKLG